MMANKKLKLIDIKDEENVLRLKRDLFSDRICDDLCEVLLSFLSFEDKIRFECVSKQFQRIIFNKQNVLQSVESSRSLFFMFDSENKKTKNSLNQLFKLNDKRMDEFVTVLQKCKSINSIDIIVNKNTMSRKLSRICRYLVDSEEILRKMIRYCPKLKSISFNFNFISNELLIRFGKKFGKNLLNINFYGVNHKFNNKYKTLLSFCVNLVSINDRLKHNSGIDLQAFVDSKQKLVPKLTKAMINCRRDGLDVEPFVTNYKNTLKSIDFDAVRESGQNSILENISQLNKLEELKLNFRIKTKPLFMNSMKAIANECKQIKSLQLILYKNEVSLDLDLMKLMKCFKQLKRLDLRLFYLRKQTKDQTIKIGLFDDCKQLTRMRISSENIDDDFYENIHLYLPQLIYLNISATNIKNKALKWISKLPNLKTFVIQSLKSTCLSQITDPAICGLINNCPNIESIIFNSRPNLTKKTIDALIRLALNKPRIEFRHYFHYLESGPHRDESRSKFTVIELKDYDIPQNMAFLDDWQRDNF